MKVGQPGIEIEELNDVWLHRYYKSHWILSVFYIFFTLCFAFGAIGFPIMLWEHWEAYDWIMLLMFIGGTIGFAFGSKYCIERTIALRKEIKSRTISEEDKNAANAASIKTAIFIVCGIVIGVIIILSVVGDALGDPRCRQCGKRGIYSQYGYCYSCYKNVENGFK